MWLRGVKSKRNRCPFDAFRWVALFYLLLFSLASVMAGESDWGLRRGEPDSVDHCLLLMPPRCPVQLSLSLSVVAFFPSLVSEAQSLPSTSPPSRNMLNASIVCCSLVLSLLLVPSFASCFSLRRFQREGRRKTVKTANTWNTAHCRSFVVAIITVLLR
jgi:hypothetical protein